MPTWKRLNIILITSICALGVLLMLIYPEAMLQSALRGLSIWWDVLFPSLLPFFIISEMLLGFGIVHFIGTLLDPIMRPLFRVPGVGGFVMAMGYASGYPVGAKLTTRLRSQGLVTREEAERLVAFTTTSDPIFLIGAVSVGFFGQADLALTLLIAHYGSGLLLGLLMRFHARSSPATPAKSIPISDNDKSTAWNSITRAFQAMHKARLEDGRAIGTLLREAVQSSIKLMIVVGGLVVFFSVVMELLTASSVMRLWDAVLQAVLHLVGLPDSLAGAFSGGLFEVTLGSKSAGSAAEAGMHLQVVAAAWVLSWAGLSVHAQIASIMNQTDMRYFPFFIARMIHSVIAAVAAYWLYPWLNNTVDHSSWHSVSTVANAAGWQLASYNLLWGGVVFIGIIAIFMTITWFIRFLRTFQ